VEEDEERDQSSSVSVRDSFDDNPPISQMTGSGETLVVGLAHGAMSRYPGRAT
jgi:hypothetical protein